MNEKQILLLCSKGNREGFDRLFRKYNKYLYYICFGYLKNNEITLDILQDVFIKIYKAFPTYDMSRSFVPWLKKIAINTCLNYLSRNKDRHNLSIDYEDDSILSNVVVSTDNVEKDVLQRESKKQIMEAIYQLPDDMQNVFILKHIEGLSYKEISNLTGYSEGTIKTWVYRARNMIKDCLIKSGICEV